MNSLDGRDPHSSEKLPDSQSDAVTCAICNRAVTLEGAKSDEYGRPVHEECYVLKTQRKLAGTPPAA